MNRLRKLTVFFSLMLLVMGAVSIAVPPQNEGDDVVIGTYHKLNSKILNEERTLLVHLPRSYHDTSLEYPVLYLLYGDHVATYFTEAVSVLERLGPTGRIPEMLLVALKNTDRYRDLLPLQPNGQPTGIEDFVRFFKEELIPHVDSRYRTKDFRVLMGPQAGGNFGMHVLFKYPDLFQAAILNNPFRWRGGRELIFQNARDVLQNREQFNRFLSITYEDGDELAKEGAAYVDRFSAFVKELGIPDFRLHLNFIANNDEFVQPMGLSGGIKALFQAYPFPEDKQVEGLADILTFYEQLSEVYGYPVDAPQHVLSMRYYNLRERGLRDQAIEVIDYTKSLYPKSANVLFIFGNLHLEAGEFEKAVESFQEMIAGLPGDTGMIQRRIDSLKRRIDSSAAYAVEKEIQRAGIEAGQKTFRDLRADSSNKYYFEEREFNELGYRLLGRGRIADAITIFKLNVELYPDSFNAYDSLAEAYMKSGDTKLAIKNYTRSLELNPNNTNAEEMLKELRKK
jgi:predicted alpha/beta superfamily hydrolase/Flp pilus assembly protein TadD